MRDVFLNLRRIASLLLPQRYGSEATDSSSELASSTGMVATRPRNSLGSRLLRKLRPAASSLFRYWGKPAVSNCQRKRLPHAIDFASQCAYASFQSVSTGQVEVCLLHC